jgi:hypothetical protein
MADSSTGIQYIFLQKSMPDKDKLFIDPEETINYC